MLRSIAYELVGRIGGGTTLVGRLSEIRDQSVQGKVNVKLTANFFLTRPILHTVEHHILQGVPFLLSRTLQLCHTRSLHLPVIL